MATKIAAKGTQLKVTISAVPTVIPSLGDITLGVGQTELLKSTTHDSSGSFHEYINGFKESDEITVEVIYDPVNAVHEYLRAAHGGAAEAFTLILPDAGAATFTFSALVRGFSVAAPVEDILKATYTLKPTGAITFTP